MHTFHVLQAISFISIVSSIPYRDTSSTLRLSKRTLPPLDIFPDDATGRDHKNKLAEALSDSLLLVQQVSLSYPGDNGSGPYKDIWSKYFPDSDHSKVQGVWNRIMSDPKKPGQGEDRLKTAVIVGTDLIKEQLNVELCQGNAEAYTNPFPAGFDPGLPDTATFTFFCDSAFTQPARYGDISCSTVGDTLSEKMEFLGGTILHEWMHNDALGAHGTRGSHIGDYKTPQDEQAGYGPYKTRQLLIKKPAECITNADSFLYLAYEIIWTKACLGESKRFKDPAPDTSVATGIPANPSGVSFTGQITEQAPGTATVVPFTTAAATAAMPSVTCEHAADPDGAMGLCPNLADNGWCDCGAAGNFATLTGSDVCGYKTIPTTGTLVLSSTHCAASSTTVVVLTETVIPLPATTTA